VWLQCGLVNLIAMASAWGFWHIQGAADVSMLADFESLEDALHTLIVFLLGLFLAEVISRWHAMFVNCQGGLVAAIDDVNILGKVYYPDDQEVNDNVLRWCLASHALLFMMAQDRDPSEVSELVDRGLLTKAEADQMVALGTNDARLPWTWIMEVLQEADKRAKGLRSENALYLLHKRCIGG